MALDPTGVTLANLIIANMALVPQGSPPSAYHTIWNSTVKAYLTTAQLTFAWVGALPSPPFTVDPITTFVGSLTYPAFAPLPIPTTSDPTTALSSFTGTLTTNLQGAVFIPNPSWTLSPMTFASFAIPLSLSPNPSLNTHVSAITNLCNKILTTFISGVGVPGAGSHGTFVGTATLTLIS